MHNECKIVFEPSGRTVTVLAGTVVLEAAARAGLVIQTPCGGKGVCRKCAIRIVDGDCPPTAACRAAFSEEKLKKGWRLGCQTRLQVNAVIEIPGSALFDSRSKILTTAAGRHLPIKPETWKKYVELTPPSMEHPGSDVACLQKAVGDLEIPLDLLQRLPLELRAREFKGTAVGCGNRLIDFEAGNTEKALYGVAFDLGTTTLVGTLMDLHTGQELGVAATVNPQVSLGDDVISRINRVRENPAALSELQGLVVRTFNDLAQELCIKAGLNRRHVYCVTVAGNTTMQHLFCGISPAALGEIPFAPATNSAIRCDATQLGFDLHPHAHVYVFPNIGSFVGGDTVAGILATNIAGAKTPTLLVDIGTNGEIVLAHDGKLLACSTAAGPAFEGARISIGMRATDGAIEKVVTNEQDIEIHVIGNTKPAGICGTALIDLAAELLNHGALDDTGRIVDPEELPVNAIPGLRARLHPQGNHVDFLIVPAAESRTGEALYLRQRDIRELQLAAAAIRAGILLMLRRNGLTPEDVDSVLLAGGFGNFIRRKNARRIGLLPPIPTERIRFVGNTSLMGAKAALLSVDERREGERLAKATEHMDLSLDPEFQMEFGAAMLFPESDATGE